MPEPHNPFVQPTPLAMGDNQAHFYQLPGGAGKPKLHFYHANGYPLPCYRSFLTALAAEYDVQGLALRPTWESTGAPSHGVRWNQYADDLIAFLESRQQGPVIGVGHSIGAVTTMLAAVKRPDLFSRLVLIDPVFLPAAPMAMMALMPWSKRKKLSIVKRALGRPDRWAVPQECIDFHAGKRAYAGFSADALQDFADGALFRNNKNEYQLSYPKRWEAHVYATGPLMWPALWRLKTPALGIRGENTDVLYLKMWARWQRMKPDHSFVQLDGIGHLAPLENPLLTATTVLNWLQA